MHAVVLKLLANENRLLILCRLALAGEMSVSKLTEGGALGGLIGIRLARHLAGHRHALTRTFSGIVIVVGLYVVVRSLT